MVSTVQSGVTSVGLDLDLLASAANLVLVDSENVNPTVAEGFQIGFGINDASDFTYTIDPFTPVSGTIGHMGTLNLSTDGDDTTAELSIGNFSIGFDETRVSETASGFFITDTLENNGVEILFDISTPGTVTATPEALTIDETDLLVAPEFATVLTDLELAADDLTGADVGDAIVEANAIETPGEPSPTPTSSTVQAGVTSVGLDLELLASAANLVLVDTENTEPPTSENFLVGFGITEASDFTYTGEPFTPISGTIAHTGTLNLSTDGDDTTTELSIGNFSIGFDETRASETASGFFITDTLEDNGVEILFDISAPGTVTATPEALTIDGTNLLVAPEFATVLTDLELATDDLTGADVGDAIVEANAVETPNEPTSGTVQSGVTSVGLDLDLLASAANLVLVDTENTEPPVSDDFQVGFGITDTSDFTYEPEPFAPVSGTIEHTGILNLSTDGDDTTTELSIGNFSIGFDETRASETASGFFITDTLEDNGVEILFDISTPGTVTATSDALTIDGTNLLVAPEFATVLTDLELATDDLTGTDVGDASINALSSQETADSGYFNFAQFTQFQLLDEGVEIPLTPTEVNGIDLAQIFDETFYLSNNPDVAAGVTAGTLSSGYEHFVGFGLAEGRDPSILFDEAFYLETNPDVAQSVEDGLVANGLVHFLNFGSDEGRDPSGVFDQEDYLTDNPDIAVAIEEGLVQNAFTHYVEFGANENRLPSLALYNEAFYLETNPDVAEAVAADETLTSGFVHYVSFGQGEGRDPSALFDESAYLEANPDVATAVSEGSFSSGFEQFIKVGRAEGRDAIAVA